jgi:hypothetical protein
MPSYAKPRQENAAVMLSKKNADMQPRDVKMNPKKMHKKSAQNSTMIQKQNERYQSKNANHPKLSCYHKPSQIPIISKGNSHSLKQKVFKVHDCRGYNLQIRKSNITKTDQHTIHRWEVKVSNVLAVTTQTAFGKHPNHVIQEQQPTMYGCSNRASGSDEGTRSKSQAVITTSKLSQKNLFNHHVRVP